MRGKAKEHDSCNTRQEKMTCDLLSSLTANMTDNGYIYILVLGRKANEERIKRSITICFVKPQKEIKEIVFILSFVVVDFHHRRLIVNKKKLFLNKFFLFFLVILVCCTYCW